MNGDNEKACEAGFVMVAIYSDVEPLSGFAHCVLADPMHSSSSSQHQANPRPHPFLSGAVTET